jgi:hypothetical protein
MIPTTYITPWFSQPEAGETPSAERRSLLGLMRDGLHGGAVSLAMLFALPA